MSIEALTWALNVDVGDSTRKLVLIGFANHAHKSGRNAWASKSTIAEYANCDPKTVGRQLRPLIAQGWLRRGNQQAVAHLRADRRPVVYDLAMSEAVRAEWQSAHAAGDSSWDSEHRGDLWWAGGTDCPPADQGHGGTHGGTSETPRGDTAVSPKPSRTIEPPPLPPEDGGSQPPALSLVCTKPGPAPHANCRACGTTSSKLAARAKAARTAAQRDADAAAIAAEREARTRALERGRSPDADQTIRATRQALARNRRSTP